MIDQRSVIHGGHRVMSVLGVRDMRVGGGNVSDPGDRHGVSDRNCVSDRQSVSDWYSRGGGGVAPVQIAVGRCRHYGVEQ